MFKYLRQCVLASICSILIVTSAYSEQASLNDDFLNEILKTPSAEIDLGEILIDVNMRVKQDLFNTTLDSKEIRQKLKELANKATSHIDSGQSPQVILDQISSTLFQELQFGTDYARLFESSLDTLLIDNILTTSKGNCLTLSLLYLYIADQMDLPISLVTVPRHIFVRYQQGDKSFNIETTDQGRIFSDQYYLDMIPGPPTMERKWSAMNKRQVLFLYLTNVANHYKLTGRYEQAIAIYQAALKELPQNASIWTNLGNVYERSGQFMKALSQYRTALELNPYLCESHYNLGLLHFLYTKDLQGAKHHGHIAQQLGCRIHPQFQLFLIRNPK